MSKNLKFLTLIITIIFVSLACNLPAATSNQPTPVQAPKVTVDPGQVLDQAIKVDPVNNSITLTLTETQINGLVQSQIQKFQTSNQFTVSDPDVKLQDGLVTLNGKVSSGMMAVNFSVSLKPSVTADHKIKLDVTKSDFGVIPIPASVTNQIAEQVSTTVNQYLNQSGETIQIDSVTISDGKLVAVAHR